MSSKIISVWELRKKLMQLIAADPGEYLTGPTVDSTAGDAFRQILAHDEDLRTEIKRLNQIVSALTSLGLR